MNGTAENWLDIPDRLAPYADAAMAVQLPGHDRPMDVLDVFGNATYQSGLGIDDYISAVTAKFPAGNDRDVVLIGHSMGGSVISHVAARHPGRIAKLIYLAAMLPDDNQSAAGILAWIKGSGLVKPLAFLGDFLPHVGKLRAVRQPIEPMEATFNRNADFEAIPRAYLRCTEDDVIPTPLQDEMVRAYPGTESTTLNRSHFPQFEDPGELAGTIKELLTG